MTLPSPLRYPTAYALLSGLLLVLAFPQPHWSLLGWVALAPLLVVLIPRRARWRMFLYGYLAGVVFFAGTCYWIYDAIKLYGRLSVVAAGALLLLLVLVFSVYFGLFGLAVGELAQRWQLAALFLSPFVWVALEWLRTYFPFGGFPWNLLGYVVAPHIGWIQPAAYTGIYGVSFLLAGMNALVAGYWLAPSRRRAVTLLLVALALSAGWFWGKRLPPVPATATAILVQTDLPQQEEFDPLWVHHHPQEVERLEQLTRDAVRQQPAPPALVIWPEVPVSLYFHHDPVIRARLLGLAQATQSYLLVGIVDYHPDPTDPQPGREARPHVYNSAVLLSPAGAFVGQYDKIHLVPFSEYMPWVSRWVWLEKLTAEVSNFRPGREAAVLPAGSARVAVVICFEAVFPGLVAEFVERGADVVVNISNDGWFGRTAAAAQHLNMARVRAVETRRFLLRVTNTGITAVVDPYGRVVAEVPAHTRTVLAAGFAPQQALSFYTRFGDWLPRLCLLVTAVALARKFYVDAVEGNDQ